MDRRVSWIADGAQVPELEGKHPFRSLDLPLRHFGLVEVEHRADLTVIRWDPACADPDSVIYALDKLSTWRAPYKLLFFRSGWLEEIYLHADQARHRIEYLQAARNAPLLNDHFFWPLSTPHRPKMFQSAMGDHERFSDFLLHCKIDDDNKYPIEFSGKSALTVQTMGGDEWLDGDLSLDVASDRAMNASCSLYRKTYETGEPQFDEVAAIIRLKGQEPYWLRWYRSLWPFRTEAGQFAIACFCIRVPSVQSLASRQFP